MGLSRRKFLAGGVLATAGSLLASGQSLAENKEANLYPNVDTSFNRSIENPQISEKAFIHPQAVVIGDAIISEGVYVAPMAVVRGDEGQSLYVGKDSNIQDCVVIHALETEENGEPVEKNLVVVAGKKYAVYVGDRVSLAHQSQVHGPAAVGNDTFVGMQALVFKARVGNNCVLEPGCRVIGVVVPDGVYVPAGMVLTKQEDANQLPKITKEYSMFGINEAVVHVNEQLAEKNLELAGE